jgi:hypothetical protein
MYFSLTFFHVSKKVSRDFLIISLFVFTVLLAPMYKTLIASDAPTIENFSATLTTDDSGNQTITVSGVVVSRTEGAFISDALVLSYYAWGGEASFLSATGSFSAVTNGAFSITLSRPTFPVTATMMGVKLTVRDSEGVSVTLATPMVSLIEEPTPTLTVTAPQEGDTIHEESIITFETSSNEGVLCNLNDSEPLLCASGVLLSSLFDIETLTPGEHVLTLTLVEDDGVTVEISVQIPEPPLPVDTTPPTIVSAVPADGALDVAPDASISLSFSEEVIFGEDSILLTSSSGNVVSHSIVSEAFTYTVIPHDLLTQGEVYTLTLSNVVDNGGNAPAPFTMSFTVYKEEAAPPSGNGARSAYDVPPPIFSNVQTPPSLSVVQEESTVSISSGSTEVVQSLPEESFEENLQTEAASATTYSQGGSSETRVNGAITTDAPEEMPDTLYAGSITETSYVSAVVMPEVSTKENVSTQVVKTHSSLGASVASSFVEKNTPLSAALSFVALSFTLLLASSFLFRARRNPQSIQYT